MAQVANIITVVNHPAGSGTFVSAYKWHDPVYALAHTDQGFVGYDAQGRALYNPHWDFRKPTKKEYELLEKIDRVPHYHGEWDELTQAESDWIFRAVHLAGLSGLGQARAKEKVFTEQEMKSFDKACKKAVYEARLSEREYVVIYNDLYREFWMLSRTEYDELWKGTKIYFTASGARLGESQSMKLRNYTMVFGYRCYPSELPYRKYKGAITTDILNVRFSPKKGYDIITWENLPAKRLSKIILRLLSEEYRHCLVKDVLVIDSETGEHLAESWEAAFYFAQIARRR